MEIQVYGKQGCKLCKSARKKIQHFLQRWNVSSVEMTFLDVESEFGAAEGDFFDVFDIPTVLLLKDESEVVARWDGKPPASGELQDLLCPEAPSAAA